MGEGFGRAFLTIFRHGGLLLGNCRPTEGAFKCIGVREEPATTMTGPPWGTLRERVGLVLHCMEAGFEVSVDSEEILILLDCCFSVGFEDVDIGVHFL